MVRVSWWSLKTSTFKQKYTPHRHYYGHTFFLINYEIMKNYEKHSTHDATRGRFDQPTALKGYCNEQKQKRCAVAVCKAPIVS